MEKLWCNRDSNSEPSAVTSDSLPVDISQRSSAATAEGYEFESRFHHNFSIFLHSSKISVLKKVTLVKVLYQNSFPKYS